MKYRKVSQAVYLSKEGYVSTRKILRQCQEALDNAEQYEEYTVHCARNYLKFWEQLPWHARLLVEIRCWWHYHTPFKRRYVRIALKTHLSKPAVYDRET